MSQDASQMWKSFSYKGFQVRVIQQWEDPFGKKMMRIAAIDDPERATGISEAELLSEGTPLPTQTDPSDS